MNGLSGTGRQASGINVRKRRRRRRRDGGGERELSGSIVILLR